MTEIIYDALADTVALAPLLLAIYVGIELIEYKFGAKISGVVRRAGIWGPAIGALAGILPQCGFSVVTTALYTRRLVTIGTLLAVYLATSDEAIPVILSQPDQAHLVFSLIVAKLVIALAAGYAVDFVFRSSNGKTLARIEAYSNGRDDSGHHHETTQTEPACCGHHLNHTTQKFPAKEIFMHPVIHTAKITIFIFLAILAINLVFAQISQNTLAHLLAARSFFPPFVVALLGMIPNCAVSVAIAELYLKGIITYGTVIAGLCASSGLGILVLLREEKSKKNIALILMLLFSISAAAGVVIQYWF